MRIQLVLLCLIFSSLSFAEDDKSMKDLFAKYDQVMDFKKMELIDDVFSKKFIQDSGGKLALIAKIKELPTPQNKKSPETKTTWRKGLKGTMYFAQVKELNQKSKKDEHQSEFIVIKEDGKLKIEGTLGDGD